MMGIFQPCAGKPLHRRVNEFNFRYSNRAALGYNDADRVDALLKDIVDGRPTYQTTGAA
ncbi:MULTISPECIES: hypothetical protein [unclassified Novosphingobium]|uniref:hypothetical protein n=1 Tax=unclassified Novosphingobium TaxID=2644732 RepID=UPI0025FA1CBE|nr:MULTISPECIES: hypothetical protein [unclassified Novosphingobium]HQV02339.1 hypothetical protein [Novosphingobium sp.]